MSGTLHASLGASMSKMLGKPTESGVPNSLLPADTTAQSIRGRILGRGAATISPDDIGTAMGCDAPHARFARCLKRALGVVIYFLIATTLGSAGASFTTEASADADQLPGALLPANRIVAYYGNPLAPTLGRLGEPPPDQMIARLHQTAAYYAEADPSRPVKPALELITPLAQSSPGDDGMYRARMSADLIDEVAGWASDNDLLLILDVQVGRSSVNDELGPLLPYLRRPNTHLALDPEFAMGPGQVPGQAIGTLDASDVNIAVQTLANVVESEHLPPKVLIVHRFLPSMLAGADEVQSDPRVQLAIDMDGFGSPAVKTTKYDAFIREAGADFGGIKLFYKYDSPLLEPEAIVSLTPSPDVVIYQ